MFPEGKNKAKAKELFAKTKARVKSAALANGVTGDEYQAVLKQEWCKVCGVAYESPEPRPSSVATEKATGETSAMGVLTVTPDPGDSAEL